MPAAFGAKKPMFAPFSGPEPESALPAYGPAITIAGLVSANMSPNLATAEFYEDDVMSEQVSEFVSAAIAMDTGDMADEVAAIIYGATYDEDTKEVAYNKSDSPPLGGLTYYKVLMRNGVRHFKGYFYPKVKAAIGNDNAQTRGSSITFQPTSTAFTVLAPNAGDWRYTYVTTDEVDIVTWMQEKLRVTPESTP